MHGANAKGHTGSKADSRGMPKYDLGCWPPPPDLPIVVDERGRPVSRYGDPIWNVSIWFGHRRIMNFGDGDLLRAGIARISPHNANLFREALAFFLFRDVRPHSPGIIYAYHGTLRVVFAYCTERNIRADHLMKHPDVAFGLVTAMAPSRQADVLDLLDRIYFHHLKGSINFSILDSEGLRRFAQAMTTHEEKQTPCIPPRIYSYIASRVAEYIESYTKNLAAFEELHKYCIDAYRETNGSRQCSSRNRGKGFFIQPWYTGSRRTPFCQVADDLGVGDVLRKWTPPPNGWSLSVKQLSAYLTGVTGAGAISIADHSLARAKEIGSMRASCLTISDDAEVGRIYFLKGVPAKPTRNELVHWVTGPEIVDTVAALSSVAKLRLEGTQFFSDVIVPPEYIDDPPLFLNQFSPWSSVAGLALEPSNPPNLGTILTNMPTLLEESALCIRAKDLEIARYVTPSLNPARFAIGSTWALGFHQFRRSGAVYMQASGVVSEDALRSQLKHVKPAMALVYGRGHSELRIDDDSTKLYRRTMYEMFALQCKEVLDDRYVSPYGKEYKEKAYELIKEKDLRQLETAAKKGRVLIRRITLGVCGNVDDCPEGGIESILPCIGHDEVPACAKLLIDKTLIDDFEEAIGEIDRLLASIPPESPYAVALEKEREGLKRAIEIAKRPESSHEEA